MPKLVSLTTALQAKGRYHDSLNLYLDVQRPGVSASWAFLYERGGRQVTLGLGSAIGGRGPKVSRALARRKAAACITLLAEGKDPKEERRRQRAEGTTLGTLLERKIAQRPELAAWERPLVRHAGTLLQRPAAAIDGDAVFTVLQPIWRSIPAQAETVRQRLESMLDYALAEGCRPSGPNPARWSGYLEHRLGARPAGGHHASLPYSEVPALMQALTADDGLGARALRLLVLCGLRSEEVRQARWTEIDGDRWTIPAERMKGKRAHVVVLSAPALAILASLPRSSAFVFATPTGKPPEAKALAKALRKAGVEAATVHGFRSSFVEWAKNARPGSDSVADWCLAHKPRGAVAQAYSREQPVAPCGKLLAAWADYCTGATAGIVRLRA